MTSPAGLATSEQYLAIARRWFTEGWQGNRALADEIFSEILTLQDQFAFLKQVGYLPDSVYAA